MRDYLLDLVEHTFDLGCIDLVKIAGDDKATAITGLAENKTVVVQGQFHNVIQEFKGTFGMPNLGKLKILLNLPEYREDAILGLNRKADGTPEGVNFKNSTGDFTNDYRFMSEQIVNEKSKTPIFRGVNWNIEFEPTVAAIMRLKMQAQANAEELNFTAKTENNDLKFYFGDHSTHAGNFVFQPDVSGPLKRAWAWPVAQVISILGLTGDKVMKISDDGAMQITVDSGLAVYTYTLPAQSK